MSELKSYKLFHRASALTSPEFISVVEFGNGDEVYLKSEADKVIAHHKYKRCLAMAEWCKSRSRYYDLLIKVEASYLLSNPHNVHKYERKAFRSKSWYIKWLELAEKFKEAE